MSIVRDEIEIFGTRKSKKILALFDTGAYRNYIKEQLEDGESPDDIGFHIYEGRRDPILADGHTATGESVRFKEVRIRNLTAKEPRFVIMKDMFESAIIGAETMQQLGIMIDPPNDRIVTMT